MPTHKSSGRKIKGGVGQSLGNALRGERFQNAANKIHRDFTATDCPKNAHLVPDWEDLEEAQREATIDKMTSVLEENDLAGLLRMANLADRDFAAERASAKVISSYTAGPVNVGDMKKAIPEECKQLPIPERPPWTKTMRKEQVDANEKEAFYNWRRHLAEIEEKYDVMLTPFEKNLEFWRQLWRVVEKSDVVVQVVDARNPLLYRSHALEEYVKKTGDWKTNVILFNKADLLPTRVRLTWARYLDGLGVKYFFFAAKSEIERRVKEQHVGDIPEEQEWNEDNEDEFKRAMFKGTGGVEDGDISEEEMGEEEINTTRVLDARALLAQLEILGRASAIGSGREMFLALDDDDKSIVSGISMTTSRQQREYIMIGFVGYPNVGKSSTINALAGAKKVGVTSTPGKTKHFQTMIVSQSVMLCDCPGLVMPSVVASRGEMVCGGILPLNVLKDHIEPMALLASRIPRIVFEETYNLNLPAVTAAGKPREYVTWTELCQGYAVSRGLLTAAGGVPETHTAARQLLKDFVRGKLRFCHMPPGVEPVALGPAHPDDRTTAEQEAAGQNPGKCEEDLKAGTEVEYTGSATTGVAVGMVRKHRKGRENRGLSAGVWAEDEEAELMKSGAAAGGVAYACGGKKKGKARNAVYRVERQFSLNKVRSAASIGMAQPGSAPA